MNLRKNKISGVSFHHRSQRVHHKTFQQKYKLQDLFNLSQLYDEIQKETPPLLTNTDIRKLLGDHGRNYINSHISQCIDRASKWTGVLKMCQRCFPEKYFLNSDYLAEMNENSLNDIQNEIEIYLSIKKLIRLWKHNLTMLEMVAQAQ